MVPHQRQVEQLPDFDLCSAPPEKKVSYLNIFQQLNVQPKRLINSGKYDCLEKKNSDMQEKRIQ